MSELVLPPPPPFLPVPGDPAVPWVRWLTSFEDYLLALGHSDLAEARKCALLRHCLGQEGQRIFATLTLSDDTYVTATAALKLHFSSGRSRRMHRFEFRQRTQMSGETVSHYVSALRELARFCDFGVLEDGLIVDQLIEKTSCNQLRERLLLEPDSTTLADALVIGKQLETALMEARRFGRAVHEPVTSSPPSVQHTEAADGVSDSLDVQRVDRGPRESGHKSCSNCGSPKHATRDQSCPAQGKRCRNCNKLNHFARCCRSSPACYDTAAVPINTVQTSQPSFKLCTCHVGTALIPLLVDTGAKVSILNKCTYDRFFSHVPLEAAAKPLLGYGHFPISTLGVARLPVRYDQQCAPAAKFCITRKGANIMGLDLFLALGFTVSDARGLHVLQVAASWPDRYPLLFNGLGRMTGFVHQPSVDLSVRPIIQPLRRIPLALRDAVEAELHRLVEADVIEPVDASPWVSNLVIAKKKGGGLRLCVDLTDVNKAIIPDKYPLPTAEELTSHFHGSTVFSKMDLRNGYLQVPLAPASMDLTAFVTHVGVFRFKRMAFGLSSAPSCFQKIMSLILAGIQGVSIYLDDVVVHAPSAALHDDRLEQVFQRFEQHGVTLNSEKCMFGVEEVEFLGFRLSEKGIAPIMSHTEAILSLPDPQSPSQLSSFLGMAAYYLRFMPHYSDSTAPLRRLLRKDVTWDWTPACHEAVRIIKRQLTSPPTLTHFSLIAPTMVTCDASGVALGAVLSQTQEGGERPVAFASRALTPAEQKYSVGEREALACLWACERWHVYLYGRPFTIRTDHQALTALLATQGSGHRPMRLLRWADRLNQYNFNLEFMPGRANTVADLLSRAVSVTKETGGVAADTESDEDWVHILHGPLSSVVTLAELQQASAADEALTTLRTYVQDGWPAKVDDRLLPYYRFRNELSCGGGVCLARGHRAVVPESLRSRVLQMAHEGHLGVVKVKQRCRDTVWWPHIDPDVEELVRNCACCLLSGKTGQPATAPLTPTPWPSSPWEHIQVDLCGELHGAPAHARYLLVVHDLHSKWPEVFQLSSISAHSIIDRLDNLFGRWGLPSVVTTDNGPQFASAEFSEFLTVRSIKHIRTAVYHPESNGGVERLNKTLKNGIRACLEEGKIFSDALNKTLLTIRASKHSTTGVSPALLMIGRELKQPLDCLRAEPAPACESPGLQKARAQVKGSQAGMKARFDATHRVQTPSLSPGVWVRIKHLHRQNKLQSYWSEPLRVTKQLGPATYRLENGTRWHSNRLHRVAAPTAPASHLAPAAALGWQPRPRANRVGGNSPAPPDAVSRPARPQRLRVPPLWHGDYVTG